MHADVDVWTIDGECLLVDLAECKRYRPTGHSLLPFRHFVVKERVVEIKDGNLVMGNVRVCITSHIEDLLTGRRTGYVWGFGEAPPRIHDLFWHQPTDFWFIHARTDGLARRPDGYFELRRDEALMWMDADRRPNPYAALAAPSEVEQPANRPEAPQLALPVPSEARSSPDPGTPGDRAILAAVALKQRRETVTFAAACREAGVNESHVRLKYSADHDAIMRLAAPDDAPQQGRRTGNGDFYQPN